MNNNEVYEVIPNAKRLIKSLRDIGYNFSTAVADLVDNSIEAGASRVDIWVKFDGDNSFLRIVDNGKGMSGSELKEAMRYGSDREYDKEDLGKFGLGLKTASMSQCRSFSVATRDSDKLNNTISFCWDLSHIEKTNRWEILSPEKKEIIALLHSPLQDHIGTVVLWERLDRILGFKHPYGEPAKKKLISLCRELEEYLAMVFHKFLSNESTNQLLDIYLNQNKIKPWDPFVRGEPATKKLSPIKIRLSHEGVSGKVVLQPYILPSKDDFSSLDAFKHASGPANWNQQQGFYIYRADRMIQSGGWCGLRTCDEHTKLSRIELNFSPVFDDAFKINVAKMRVQLPIQIRDDIEMAIRPAVRLAREIYDRKSKPSPRPNTSTHTNDQSPSGPATNTQNSATDSKNSSSSQSAGPPYESKAPRLFTFDEIEQKATELANDTEKHIIAQVFQRLRNALFGR